MNNENTNWGQSVTGVVIREGKVLLARHTYGGGAGKLILPGGYVEKNGMPQEALRREDVPDLTKKLIQSAVSGREGLKRTEYESGSHPPCSLYC